MSGTENVRSSAQERAFLQDISTMNVATHAALAEVMTDPQFPTSAAISEYGEALAQKNEAAITRLFKTYPLLQLLPNSAHEAQAFAGKSQDALQAYFDAAVQAGPVSGSRMANAFYRFRKNKGLEKNEDTLKLFYGSLGYGYIDSPSEAEYAGAEATTWAEGGVDLHLQETGEEILLKWNEEDQVSFLSEPKRAAAVGAVLDEYNSMKGFGEVASFAEMTGDEIGAELQSGEYVMQTDVAGEKRVYSLKAVRKYIRQQHLANRVNRNGDQKARRVQDINTYLGRKADAPITSEVKFGLLRDGLFYEEGETNEIFGAEKIDQKPFAEIPGLAAVYSPQVLAKAQAQAGQCETYRVRLKDKFSKGQQIDYYTAGGMKMPVALLFVAGIEEEMMANHDFIQAEGAWGKYLGRSYEETSTSFTNDYEEVVRANEYAHQINELVYGDMDGYRYDWYDEDLKTAWPSLMDMNPEFMVDDREYNEPGHQVNEFLSDVASINQNPYFLAQKLTGFLSVLSSSEENVDLSNRNSVRDAIIDEHYALTYLYIYDFITNDGLHPEFLSSMVAPIQGVFFSYVNDTTGNLDYIHETEKAVANILQQKDGKYGPAQVKRFFTGKAEQFTQFLDANAPD